MRKAVLELSGVLLSAVIAACAQAPVDDDPGGATQATAKTDPEENSAKLPASNPPAPKDAGTTSHDSGTSTSSSSSGGSSSGGSSSGGSSSGGSSSGGSSSGGSSSGSSGGGSCDPNNALYLIEALDEINKTSPRTCGIAGGSCKSAECCFDVYGVCVDL